MSILSLNDDCLLQIFSYLPIRDLMVLEEVSMRFCALTWYTYRFIRKFTWCKSAANAANKEIFRRIGPHLHEITYHGMGNSDHECFRIITENCTNVRKLRLFEISVSLGLVHQMLPLLETIDSLEIDEYFTQSPTIASDFSCLILCAETLRELRVGRPLLIYGHFIPHDYLVALTTVQDLSINLIGDGFLNISRCFCSNSTLRTVHLVLPDGDYENYHIFCSALVNLTSLVELHLENLKNKSFESLFIALAELLKLNTLQEVHLKCSQDTTITARAQRAMARMRNLPRLTLNSLKNLSYDFLNYHLWLRTLKSFTLINCPGFTTENLHTVLARAEQLTEVTIRECPKVSWDAPSCDSHAPTTEPRNGTIRIARENILLPFTIRGCHF